ncbi:hypothetical protein HID58_018678, partial [Brassica napus]
MNSKDKVLLVVGAWVSDTHKPDHSFKGEHYINLYSGMNMSDFVRGVREEIDPTYEEVNFKLSYQYPEWISADGGALDMPQYITEDTEVGVFIELRRSIEAVNLLVSVRSPMAHDEGPASYINSRSAEHCDIEDDEWHEFAMANNTVTIPDTTGCPGKKNLESGDAIPHVVSGIAYSRTSAIPFQIGGVEIREPEHNIRQRIQPEPGVAMEKGKKKMKIETPSDTDSDSDDDMVVPVFRTTTDLSGKGKRPIWERLIYGIPGIPNICEEDNDRRRTTAAGQYNAAAEGQYMVNDPRIPDLLEREEPPTDGTPKIGCGVRNIRCPYSGRIPERHHHQSGGAYVVAFTGTTRQLVASQCNNQTTGTGIKREGEAIFWKLCDISGDNQMTSQDRVLLIIGSWVRDQYKRWVFEPDISNQLEHYIRHRTGKTLRELLTAVRERLQWVSFDDPELGLPVYITDDLEVRGFIEMRRAIEELNLFVSLVCPTEGLQIARETAHMNPTMAARVNPIMNESWHDFAISETPLTLPQTEPNANRRVIEVPDDSISRQEGGVDCTGRRAIPFTMGGIEIREPNQAIRFRSPPIAATDKGKNKMPSESSSDTDSDDDMVVPVLQTSVDIGEGANMPVRRLLIFGILEPIEDPNNSSASEQMPLDDGIHWGRFDQALHDMLNDPENPALLGRDAPPVFNARLVS